MEALLFSDTRRNSHIVSLLKRLIILSTELVIRNGCVVNISRNYLQALSLCLCMCIKWYLYARVAVMLCILFVGGLNPLFVHLFLISWDGGLKILLDHCWEVFVWYLFKANRFVHRIDSGSGPTIRSSIRFSWRDDSLLFTLLNPKTKIKWWNIFMPTVTR